MSSSPAMDQNIFEEACSLFASRLTAEEKHVFGQTTLSVVLQTTSEITPPVASARKRAVLMKLNHSLNSIGMLEKVLVDYPPDCSGYIWVMMPSSLNQLSVRG